MVIESQGERMKTNNQLLREALSISMDINKAYGKLLKSSHPSKETKKIKELDELSNRIMKALDALDALTESNNDQQ